MAEIGALPPLAARLKPSCSGRYWGRAAVVKRPANSLFARPGGTDRASPVRRRGDRDLGDADVGVGQHRLGSLDASCQILPPHTPRRNSLSTTFHTVCLNFAL